MNIFSKAGSYISQHSTDIKFTAGVAGLIGTCFLVGYETVKAVRAVDRYKEENQKEKLTLKETVQVTWKYYISPVVTGAVSTLSLVSSQKDYAKTNAALAAACAVSESAATVYDKAIKSLDEETAEKVKTAVTKETLKEAPPAPTTNNIYISESEDVLCYEPLSRRYFNAKPLALREAVVSCNETMVSGRDESVSCQEWFCALNLPFDRMPNNWDELGWSIEKTGLMDVDIRAELTEEGRPCIALIYMNQPVYGFDKSY